MSGPADISAWLGHATVDRTGRIEIRFNAQENTLLAPSDETGPRKYLPCVENCGEILIVSLDTVSIMCECCERDDESLFCDRCGALVHPDNLTDAPLCNACATSHNASDVQES